MKKIIVFIASLLLSLDLFCQNLNQQMSEIESIIRPEIEAKAREALAKEKEKQAQMQQAQMQTTQSSAQTAQQQAIQDFNNKISSEGMQRMEYYNNPDNYIDRSLTNRGSALNNTNSHVNSPNRYNSQNQYNDLRTRPIHSEELTSQSLQMLHEANREYFSTEDREITINPNVRVQLFDAPSLEYKPYVDKPDRKKRILNEQARKGAERKKLENEVAVRNDLIDLSKSAADLVGGVMMDDAIITSVKVWGVELGKGTAGFLLSENLSLFSEMAKYWNECSAGTKTTKRDFNRIERELGIDQWESLIGPEMVDSYEMIKNATVNSAIGKVASFVGDKAGVAYVNFEKMGTGAMEVFTSMKIALSLSNFAVSNEKHEE